MRLIDKLRGWPDFDAIVREKDIEQLLSIIRKHRSEKCRVEAIETLKETPLENKVDVLLEVLDRDRSPSVQIAAIVMLGEVRSKAAVTPLCHFLAKSPNGLVKLCAADALGNIGDADEYVLAILTNILGDVDQNVGVAASFALAKLGTPANEFLRGACTDENHIIRANAIRALAAINGFDVLDEIMNALDDPEPFVSYTAQQVLNDIRKEGKKRL